MVDLAVVVLAVENYLESIQQAVLQVHLDKVMQVAQALEAVLAVKQVAAVAVQALLEVPVPNFLVALVVMVLHHPSQEQALHVVAVAVADSLILALQQQAQAVLAVVVQEALPLVLDHLEQQILAAAVVALILPIMSAVTAAQVL
jgi:hypothetical protein